MTDFEYNRISFLEMKPMALDKDYSDAMTLLTKIKKEKSEWKKNEMMGRFNATIKKIEKKGHST